MVGRPREPVDLLIAKGKKHLSKKEIEERRSQELEVPFLDVVAPDYLSKKQQNQFTAYASKLLELGIMTELDVDCLARYILSQDLYLEYTNQISVCMRNGDFESLKDLQNMQDKVFRQAQTSARDLGLTITSRCKIVIPTPPDSEDDEL